MHICCNSNFKCPSTIKPRILQQAWQHSCCIAISFCNVAMIFGVKNIVYVADMLHGVLNLFHYLHSLMNLTMKHVTLRIEFVPDLWALSMASEVLIVAFPISLYLCFASQLQSSENQLDLLVQVTTWHTFVIMLATCWLRVGRRLEKRQTFGWTHIIDHYFCACVVLLSF